MGKILPDGHLSIPEEAARFPGKEFEVFMSPVDDVRKSISLYLDGQFEKKGWVTDIILDSKEVEEAIQQAFGTSDIDKVMESLRR